MPRRSLLDVLAGRPAYGAGAAPGKRSFILGTGWGTTYGEPSRDYVALRALTLRNPYASRAYSLIADALAGITWLHAQNGVVTNDARIFRSGEGFVPSVPLERIYLEESSWAPPLSPVPALDYPGAIARELWDGMAHAGEVYTFAPGSPITGTNAGRTTPAGLLVARPDLVRMDRREPDGEVRTWALRERNERRLEHSVHGIRIERAVYLEDPNNPGRGFPIAAAAARTAAMLEQQEHWQSELFENRGAHPGFFRVTASDATLTDEAFEDLRVRLQKAFSADRAAGVPGLIENLDWLATAWTPVESAMHAGEIAAVRRIAAGWGVPVQLLGDAAASTYSNLRTAVAALITQRALPLAEWIMSVVADRVLPPDESFVPDMDAIASLTADLTELYARAREASGGPFLTVDEARSLANWGAYKPTPGAGGTLLRPLGLIPVDDAPPPDEDEETDAAG